MRNEKRGVRRAAEIGKRETGDRGRDARFGCNETKSQRPLFLPLRREVARAQRVTEGENLSPFGERRVTLALF